MPKRVIDGDSLWVSEKLTNVPERYRAEYAWLLPLANVNGCFECSPMLVWRTCYSALRPEWSKDDVAVMLDAFEAAKMLFRFQRDGKTFGFFVGVQKEGRLPGAAERSKYRKPWGEAMLPGKELSKFLEVSVKQVSEEYRGLLADTSKKSRDTSLVGNGNGNGVGSGAVLGSGSSNGLVLGSVSGVMSDAATPPTQPATLSQHSQHSQHSHDSQNTNTQNNNTNTSRSRFESDAEPDEEWESLTAQGFATLFRLVLRNNPKASEPPKGWADMWAKDFKALLEKTSELGLIDLIIVSQLEKNQPFYVRPAKLLENFDLLAEMVEERKKAMPVLRAEFKKTVTTLEREHEFI